MKTSKQTPAQTATAIAVAKPPPDSTPPIRRVHNTDALLSKGEVMAQLGIGEKALRRLIQNGRLAVVKFGKTSPLKFRQLDVARLLESAVAQGPTNPAAI